MHKVGNEFVLVLVSHLDTQLVVKSVEYGPIAKMQTAIKSLPNRLSDACINHVDLKQKVFSS